MNHDGIIRNTGSSHVRWLRPEIFTCIELTHYQSPWTVAHQAPLFMEFSRQQYWGGLPSPSPKDLPDPWIKPRFPALQADSLPAGLPRSLLSFSLVAQSCPTLCDPMNRSMPGLPVHHQLPQSTQTHIHWVGDAIQPFHPLSSPSPPALNLSQHQGLFQWVSSSQEVPKVLEFQLQHQSFQWTPRADLL